MPRREVRESGEDDVPSRPGGSETARNEIDNAAWRNSRQAHEAPSQVVEAWKRSHDDAQGEISLRAQDQQRPREETDKAAWDNAQKDGAEDSARVAEARTQVEAALAQTLPEAGSHNFELDSESHQRATDLGARLADMLPAEQWKSADYPTRHHETVDLGLSLSRQLDMPPNIPIVDLDMPPELFGSSQGEIVRVNARVLDNSDPKDMIETMAHEYRHQWQDAVLNGTLEHPVGDSAFHKLIAADIYYVTDAKDYATYGANYREVDAEEFAMAVSKAYAASREPNE